MQVSLNRAMLNRSECQGRRNWRGFIRFPERSFGGVRGLSTSTENFLYGLAISRSSNVRFWIEQRTGMLVFRAMQNVFSTYSF